VPYSLPLGRHKEPKIYGDCTHSRLEKSQENNCAGEIMDKELFLMWVNCRINELEKRSAKDTTQIWIDIGSLDLLRVIRNNVLKGMWDHS
jgi:hypothetical protein